MYDCFRIRCFRFAYSLNRADAALTFFMDCILVTGAFKGTSSARLHAREPLSIRRELHKLSQFYKIVKNLAPLYLNNYCPNYLVNVHIFVSNQEKTSLNFVVELLSFKILFSRQQSLAGILWT